MSRRHSLRSAAVAAALAALLASGCYGPYYGGQPGYGGPPARSAPSGPPGPGGRMMQPRIGIGASAGGMIPSDEFLTGGIYVGGQASLWLSDMIGFQVDVGRVTFDDQFEWYTDFAGDLTVTPMTFSVVFSVLDPFYANDMYRWRFGIGVGEAKLDHSDPLVDLENITIFTVQMGGEFALTGMGPGPASGRVFVVVDWILGEEAEAEVGSEIWTWDLSGMAALRIGMEFQF